MTGGRCTGREEEVTAQDNSRQEAFTLSRETDIKNITDIDDSHLMDLLTKSERLLEIEQMLNMKMINQMEAVERVFHLAMMTENIEKVLKQFYVLERSHQTDYRHRKYLNWEWSSPPFAMGRPLERSGFGGGGETILYFTFWAD